MARIVWAASIAILLGIALPAPAQFGFWSRHRVTTAYYLPVPVAVVAVPVPVVCLPLPYENPPPLYAQPQPAPPTSAEPPLADTSKDKPATLPARAESTGMQARSSSYFDSYAVASAGPAQPRSERCSVSFWNLAPKDLVLKLGDRRLNLATGRSLTLGVDRQFTWQIEGRDSEKARVADENSAVEIVIRR
jgi:hypothetical protein